jgi:hypothetical protein
MDKKENVINIMRYAFVRLIVITKVQFNVDKAEQTDLAVML